MTRSPPPSAARPARRRRRAGPALLVASLAVLAFGGRTALAQEPSPGDDALFEEETRVGHTFRVNNWEEARINARLYAKFAADGEWSLAVESLQKLLDMPSERGLVVDVPGSNGTRFVGLALFARDLFDELPAEGRAAWEQIYREGAEALLARGIRLRRPEDLSEAARRFPAADVRRRAFDALARLSTSRGDFSRAAYALERLLPLLPETELPQGYARLGLVRAMSGDRAATDRVRELAHPHRQKPVPGPSGPEPLGTFLERMVAAAGPAAAAVSGWPQFSGNPSGTRLASMLPEPLSPAWNDSVPTDFREGEENPRRQRWIRPETRPVQPVIAGNSVILNSGLTVRSIDLASGLQSWSRRAPRVSPDWRDNHASVLGAAVMGDRVYAPLATRADAPATQRKFMSYWIIYALPHRALFALDRTTGEEIWSHADERLVGRDDAAEVMAESVAGPPLVVGDDLIVAAWTFESAYELRLVCYDRHSGATRWRRTLVHGQQELNLFGRPVKELAVSGLAELDGVVYLSTGLGVAAAVDRTSGEVRWITAYPRVPIPRSTQWFETTDRESPWRPAPVAATRSRIVMAPSDSPYLLAFDPETGVVHWKVHHRDGRRSYSWFAGVANDKAYVVGDRLAAFRLSDGERVWSGDEVGRLSRQYSAPDRAFGRPVLTEDRVYVPGEQHVYVMNARTGVAEDVWALPEGAGREWGDLLGADGTLLVVGRDDILCYYRFDQLERRLQERLERHPDDPQLRLEAGEIYRTSGRLDEAIAQLDRGLELTRGLAPLARKRLDGPLSRTLYAALAARSVQRQAVRDDAGALTDLERAVEIAAAPEDATLGLFEIARVCQAFDRIDRAEAALQRIVAEHADVVLHLDGRGSVHVGALAMLRLGELDDSRGRRVDAATHWLDVLEAYPDADLGESSVPQAVRMRLERLLLHDDAQVRDTITERAKRALAAAQAEGDAGALARVARLYPDPSIAALAALAAADAHLAAHRRREAVLTLRDLLRRDALDERTTARALWRLARAFRELRATAQERRVLERMVREVADVRLAEGTAGDFARAELGAERFRAGASTLPAITPPLAELWQASPQDGLPPSILRVLGVTPEALLGNFLTRGDASQLALLDGRSGTALWRRIVSPEIRHVVGTETHVAVVGGRRRGRSHTAAVEALDAATGEPAWSRELPGLYRQADSSLGAVYVLTSETDPSGEVRFSLTAVDLTTGDVLATRTFADSLSPQVTAAEDAVLVYAYSPTRNAGPERTVIVLDAATLAVRGRVDLRSRTQRQPAFHRAPEPIAVIVDEERTSLVGIDLGRGAEVWRRTFAPEGANGEADTPIQIKTVHPVASGVIVADEENGLRRLDLATGQDVWLSSLAGIGELVFGGMTVEDGTVVANVQERAGGPVTSVCLDGADGREQWRAELGPATQPATYVCQDVVAYQLKFWNKTSHSDNSVLLVDRKTGRELQRLAPERLARQHQMLYFAGTRLAIATTAALCVFGEE